MKQKTWVETISFLFILLFMYTASSKIIDIWHFRRMIHFGPILKDISNSWALSNTLAWSVILSEIIISLFLIFPRTRRVGLWLSFFIMLIFTSYLGYIIFFSPSRPCSCGGVIEKMTWPQHFIFNVFFLTLATLGLWLDKRSSLKINPRVSYQLNT